MGSRLAAGTVIVAGRSTRSPQVSSMVRSLLAAFRSRPCRGTTGNG